MNTPRHRLVAGSRPCLRFVFLAVSCGCLILDPDAGGADEPVEVTALEESPLDDPLVEESPGAMATGGVLLINGQAPVDSPVAVLGGTGAIDNGWVLSIKSSTVSVETVSLQRVPSWLVTAYKQWMSSAITTGMIHPRWLEIDGLLSSTPGGVYTLAPGTTLDVDNVYDSGFSGTVTVASTGTLLFNGMMPNTTGLRTTLTNQLLTQPGSSPLTAALLNTIQSDLVVRSPIVLRTGTALLRNTTVNHVLSITNGATWDAETVTVGETGTLILGGGRLVYERLDGRGLVNSGSGAFVNPAGSTVSGFLTFAGDFVNQGNLSPGASPGITVVQGNFVNAGTFHAEIGGLGAAGANPDGFDQTRVGGTATAGGVLNVQGFNGFLPSQGDRFQVIANAVGGPIGVAGTFDAVTFDADGVAGSGAPVRNAAVVFDRATGAVTATGLNAPGSRFADLGSNANQRAVAASLFNAALVGPNQIDSSTTPGLLALQITDAANSSGADLARYVPDYYGSIADYAFLGDAELARSIQDQLTPFHDLRGGVADEGSGGLFFGYLHDSSDTSDGVSLDRSEYYFGAGLVTGPRVSVGLAGSFNEGSAGASLGSAELEGAGVLLYMNGALGADFGWFGSLGYSSLDVDLARATVNGRVSGETEAATWTGLAGVAYRGWRFGEVLVRPQMLLIGSSTDVDGFRESGAVDALALSGWSASRWAGEAGLSAVHEGALAQRPFHLELSASLRQALARDTDLMQARLMAVPDAAYPVGFAEDAEAQAVLRANAAYEWMPGVQAYAGYGGLYGGEISHAVRAGVRIRF